MVNIHKLLFTISLTGTFDHPSDPSTPSSSDDDNEGDNSNNLLHELSKKWLMIQLTHNVSAAATNSFWDASMSLIPGLLEARQNLETNSKIPGFIHTRRKLYQDMCPPVQMTFAYLSKVTGEIEYVECTTAPTRTYPKSLFTKLYEEAHIKVIYSVNFFLFLGFNNVKSIVIDKILFQVV